MQPADMQPYSADNSDSSWVGFQLRRWRWQRHSPGMLSGMGLSILVPRKLTGCSELGPSVLRANALLVQASGQGGKICGWFHAVVNASLWKGVVLLALEEVMVHLPPQEMTDGSSSSQDAGYYLKVIPGIRASYWWVCLFPKFFACPPCSHSEGMFLVLSLKIAILWIVKMVPFWWEPLCSGIDFSLLYGKPQICLLLENQWTPDFYQRCLCQFESQFGCFSCHVHYVFNYLEIPCTPRQQKMFTLVIHKRCRSRAWNKYSCSWGLQCSQRFALVKHWSFQNVSAYRN